MDFGFEGFESSDFDVGIEEVEVRKTKTYDRIWKMSIGGSIDSSPVIRDGIVYFGCCDQNVYAVDISNGQEIWRVKTDGIITDSTPIFHGDVFFIGSFDGKLYAIDSKKGEIIWTFQTGDSIFVSGALGREKFYFGSKDGYVYCITIEGKEAWKFRTGGPVASMPRLYNGRLYVTSYDHNMYCLDAETGKEIWRLTTGDEMVNDVPFCIYKDIIYFASMDSFVYAADVETGKLVWKKKTGNFGNSGGTPTVRKGILYHGSRSGVLYALDPESGKELWQFSAGGAIIDQSYIMYKEQVIFGCEDGNIYAVSNEGKEVWRFKTGGKIYNEPLIHDDLLYFGSWDCNLYCINLETRKEVWRFVTSTKVPSSKPPLNEVFEVQVKKETHIEDAVSEDKYNSKKEEVSLSDYHVTSEYSTTSEYKQKSDYDTSFVILEEVLAFNPDVTRENPLVFQIRV
ncbi:MAG: PQQ-binding-like beta-propeller repeat protein [Candidatus Aenigmarchaeota archaeon]|nr:PQQ-binding-like beta-propeller repeat protein [Candidatus Aenigmarchaeota archaeon]NIP40336.1 PQQ-binding-like beta-propeller repeat protein [Candidatus Aenigmarchaeota archaeon]NIQ17830.1 PQQ-binding-like beta-propeller repeat protein [Candidatus Aenigmarchaeota archaeon]NIS73211.1 PQQ-binding-like beta-propeller repeat protein [Candidatus Aenigmarchaeota archaeon]